jgi:REJ domain.
MLNCVRYVIDWGDGSPEDKVDHSYRTSPQEFYLKHTYFGETTYTLVVEVADKVNRRIVSDPVYIIVTNCSVPDLLFNFGTLENPRQYTRGQRIIMRGFWTLIADCAQVVKTEFQYHNASFVSTSSGLSVSDELNFEFDIDKRLVAYTIPERAYKAGYYKLTLSLTYKRELYEYLGYFRVLQSPLEVVITNNNFQTFPTKQKDGTFYNLKIYGDKSRDPDDKLMGYSGMNFTWFCRLKTDNDTLVEHEKIMRNDSSVPYKCLNKEWRLSEPYAVDTVNADISARNFLQNVEYVFRLNIEKGLRLGYAEQTVLFAEGDPPTVLLLCKDNCGAKINTQSELSYTLGCDEYSTDLR